jgi:hypothetical protein
MTIKVSICNLDLHRKILVTQCPLSQPDARPMGIRHPVVIDPLTAMEFYVHKFQTLEIEEVKP